MVEQLGLATMPLVAVERVGVDLGDDQRHVVVHAPVAGVVDDDRAGLDQPRRPLGADRAARRGENDVEALDRLLGARRPALERRAVPLDLAPGRALGGEGNHLGRREITFGENSRIVDPDQPGRAHNSDSVSVARHRPIMTAAQPRPWGGARRPSGPRGGSRRRPARRPRAAPCTASGTRSAEMTHEILIGEVEIISMLIPSAPSTSKTLAATPGCERMPAPTIETLPIRSSVRTPWLTSPSAAIVSLATGQIGAVDREGEVGELVAADRLVLDDHVDVDVGLGQGREDSAGDARARRGRRSASRGPPRRSGSRLLRKVAPWSPARPAR